MKNGKKGSSLLVENIIFISLNLVFLTILLLFVYSKMDSAAIQEEKYVKMIALMLDRAKPGMKITLNMKDAFEKKDDGWEGSKVVSITGNVVYVKLREKGGYAYSFFNDVDVGVDFVPNEEYVFVVRENVVEKNE